MSENTYFTAAEIIARAKAGTGGLIVWSIDAAYPPETLGCDHPRVGRFNAMYTLETGKWCRIPHKAAKAAALAELLAAELPTIEWATAYDDPPQDDEEKPYGIGPAGKEKLMAYRGRVWDLNPAWHDCPYEEGVESEICDFSMNDVGSCCYYEKKDGVYDMVIG